jgi:hypothetical protein
LPFGGSLFGWFLPARGFRRRLGVVEVGRF